MRKIATKPLNHKDAQEKKILNLVVFLVSSSLRGWRRSSGLFKKYYQKNII